MTKFSLHSLISTFIFTAIAAAPSNALAKSWWDKNRSGAETEAPQETSSEVASEEVAEATEEVPSIDSNSDFEKELTRRKQAAKKARAAISKPSLEADLTNLETKAVPAPVVVEKKAESLPELTQSADTEILKPVLRKKKSKAKKASRTLASVDSVDVIEEEGGSSRTKSRVRSKGLKGNDGDNLFRIGLLSGISSVATSSGATGGGALLNIALQADFQRAYWGLELDTYYGLGMGLSTDSSGTSGSTTQQSQFGAFVAAKAKTTFRSGSFRFTPKAGLGFGMMNSSGSSDTLFGTTTLTATTNSSVQGAFAMAGFDMTLTRWFFITADFARSVVASGKAQASIGTESASVELEGAQFQRIRVGANFLISDHLILGGQYYKRDFIAGGNASPQGFILAHLGYQW